MHTENLSARTHAHRFDQGGATARRYAKDPRFTLAGAWIYGSWPDPAISPAAPG